MRITKSRIVGIAGLAMLGASVGAAQITYDSAHEMWTLRSGVVEYRLQRQKDVVLLSYLGPAGRASWPSAAGRVANYDIAGLVDGETLMPQDLALISHQVRQPREDCFELRLVYKHRRVPLEIEALYTTWGDTGVFTRQLIYTNQGGETLRMEAAPSLAWRLPSGGYTLDYLHGYWGEERQLASEKLGPGRKSLLNTAGRSSNGYSPWFSLRNDALGVRFAAQLAYSGNWEMSFDAGLGVPGKNHNPQAAVQVALGMRFDFGGAAPLKPGASFRPPGVAFTASGGDLDDVANQLHRYQRRFVIPRIAGKMPALTQFNSWYCTPVVRKPDAGQIKQFAAYAADLGLEAVVIDSGWFSDRGDRQFPIFGDWDPDPVTFPKGLREVADYVHAKGMKFGAWLEIETADLDSRVVGEHPDWLLRYKGEPIPNSPNGRKYLNFGKPEVRRWARSVIDRFVRNGNIDYWRLDYNVNIGEYFDPPAPGQRSGTVLYDHLANLLALLDEVRAAYPNLFFENCASGGLRLDLAMIARTHTTWVSDAVDPRRSVQLAYGCTMEFTPEVCNHWMAGDDKQGKVDVSKPPGWWDFMFRVPMNGQFGMSSRFYEWSPEVKKRAAENVTLYKRVRPVILGGDVYHLTPPPEAGTDPAGWMALEYSSEDRRRSVVMAYRLGQSDPRQTLHLRGLDPDLKYRVAEAGRSLGIFSGRRLSSEGLQVALDSEWRSAVIELEGGR